MTYPTPITNNSTVQIYNSSGVQVNTAGAGCESVCSGNFAPSFGIFTGGVTQIPAGVKSWSVGVVSGAIYIDGAGPLQSVISINGGGYANNTLSTPIVISGAAGCNALILWES